MEKRKRKELTELSGNEEVEAVVKSGVKLRIENVKEEFLRSEIEICNPMCDGALYYSDTRLSPP